MSYVIRVKWDSKKRPQRLALNIDQRYWRLTPAERQKRRGEISLSVRGFLSELSRLK